MKKTPFKYSLRPVELFAYTMDMPQKEFGVWARRFILDLIKGQSADEFTLGMIKEVETFRQRQSECGKEGMDKRWHHDK